MKDRTDPRRYGAFIECASCHERIQSKHRHDFVTCKCGDTYVDGGSDYLRCGGKPVIENGTIKTWVGGA